ncbi:MAG: diacylglycerol kinase family protein [Polyangiales bacterium]
MATHLLVGNPTAQSGKNAQRIQTAIDLLRTRGVDCDLFSTLPAGRTIDALRETLDRSNYTCVISMGGDGTFREVASALYASRRREEIAMGMLPTGTANDQGRSFNLEAREDALPRNADIIARGRETRIDAGLISTRSHDGSHSASGAFFDSAGWGLSARTLATRNRDRRLVDAMGPLKEIYRDQLVYAGALMKNFLESYVVRDKFRARVVADGEARELDGLTDLIVKNTRYYGGAWVFDRTSRHDDGLFEIIPFRGKRDWTSKAIVDFDGNPITEEILNRVGIEHSKPFRGHHIVMTLIAPSGGAPLAAQIDGEEFPAYERVEIEVATKAIRLIVP